MRGLPSASSLTVMPVYAACPTVTISRADVAGPGWPCWDATRGSRVEGADNPLRRRCAAHNRHAEFVARVEGDSDGHGATGVAELIRSERRAETRRTVQQDRDARECPAVLFVVVRGLRTRSRQQT